MNEKQKRNLVRILIAAGLMIGLAWLPLQGWMRFIAYMVPYLIIGYDILLEAAEGIRNGDLLTSVC